MHVAHWLFARLRASGRQARSVAIVGASVALLCGSQSAAAALACPGSQIVNFVTRVGIVGWTVRIDKNPKCAFPSLVVIMDLIDVGQKVHKFNFTLQYDANTRQLMKASGIDEKFPNLYYGPASSTDDTLSFVLSHHYILGNQVSIRKVKMFAAFAGRTCRYEGDAVGPRNPGPDPIIHPCFKKRPVGSPKSPSR